MLNGLKLLGKGALLEDVYAIFEQRGIVSERISKETVWRLVEQGKVKFNRQWLLEYIKTSKYE